MKLLALENRLVFDGAIGLDVITSLDAGADVLVLDAASSHGLDVAVIDKSISGYEQIAASLGDRTRVIFIEQGDSGLDVLMRSLSAESSKIDTLRVFSHGAAGSWQLGMDTIDSSTINTHAETLAAVGSMMAQGGDVLIFSCDVAQGALGQQLIDDIAKLIGADVAASTDLTGSSAAGGDWDLEYQVGNISNLAVDQYQDLSVTLSSSDYTEDQTAQVIGSSITVVPANGSDYAGGSVTYTLANASSAETLSFQTAGSASTGAGDVTIVGTSVYLGNGTTAAKIGSVDAFENGANGNALKINFTTSFTNGGFNGTLTTSGNTTSIEGWTVYNTPYYLGTTTIGGFTADASLDQVANNPSRGNTTGYPSSVPHSLSTTAQDGGIKMTVGSASVSPGGHIIHGPYLVSDGSVALSATDVVKFNWAALSGGDAYDVYAYLQDVNTGAVIELMDENGTASADYSNWNTTQTSGTADPSAARSITIQSGQEGNYRFVFVAGTFDYTFGQLSGGSLIIDNVTVTQAVAPPSTIGASTLNLITDKLQYQSSAQDINRAQQNRSLTLEFEDKNAVVTSGSHVFTEIGVNDAPTWQSSLSMTVSEDASPNGGSTVASLFAGAFGDVDGDSLGGVVIASNAANASTEGVWEYTTDGGSNWHSVGTVSTTQGLLLDSASTTKLRFVPVSNFTGAASGLSVFAVDDASSLTFTSGNTRAVYDTTTDGATDHVAVTSGTLSISVTAVNDDPTAAGLPSAVTVVEDVASNLDLSAVTLADVDAGSSNIDVTLTAGAGTIAASSSGGVTVAGSGSGTLTLTGTVSDIDAYLNTASNIKYTGVLNANGNSATTITVSANDGGNTGSGGGTSVTLGSVDVDITAVNDAPTTTAVSVNGNITEGSSLSSTGSITFADVDTPDRPTATEVTKSVVALKADGQTSLTLTAAQRLAIEDAFSISPAVQNTNTGTVSWSYTISESNLDFLAKDETITAVFTITVDDGNGATSAKDVSVTLTGTNDAPVLSGSGLPNIQTPLGVAYELDVTTVLSDPDGSDSLTFTATGLPQGLTIDAATGIISGTPITSGPFSVVVRATDPHGSFIETSFTALVLAPPQTAGAPSPDGPRTPNGPTDKFNPQVTTGASQASLQGSSTEFVTVAGLDSLAVNGRGFERLNGLDRAEDLGQGDRGLNNQRLLNVDLSAALGGADAASGTELDAKLADGNDLPDWLTFDETSQSFVGTVPDGVSGTIEAIITIRRAGGVEEVIPVNIDLENLSVTTDTVDPVDSGDSENSSEEGVDEAMLDWESIEQMLFEQPISRQASISTFGFYKQLSVA